MKHTLLLFFTLASGEILFSQNAVRVKVSEVSGTPLIGAAVVIKPEKEFIL